MVGSEEEMIGGEKVWVHEMKMCEKCKRPTMQHAYVDNFPIDQKFVAINLALCLFTCGFWVPILGAMFGFFVVAKALSYASAEWLCEVCHPRPTQPSPVPPVTPQSPK